MTFQEKIGFIRSKMRGDGISAYIVYSQDPHGSVAVADHWRTVGFLTGFTGWVCTLVVTRDAVAFWTDGRYVEQAKRELSGTGILRFCISSPGDPSLAGWLSGCLPAGSRVGLDGRVLSWADAVNLEKALKRKKITVSYQTDYLSLLWTERPPVPRNPVFQLDVAYAGKSRLEKLARVRHRMEEAGADYYLNSGLDDLAWLTNLRGADSPLYPVFHGYLLISMREAWLFTDRKKIPDSVKEALCQDGIQILEPGRLPGLLAGISGGSAVYFDPYKTGAGLRASLPGDVLPLEGLDFITDLKSCKNEVEIDHIRLANKKEGACVVRLIKYIKEHVGKERLTEYEAGRWIERERKKIPEYLKPANIPIVGYGGNAVELHYRPTPEHSDELKPEGLLLFDLCAHYLLGSTDITRTISLGPLTKEMGQDYTMTLKSHIRLATQKFPKGCTGPVLDGIVKSTHWNGGLDYGAGTGHGMGYCAYIQEGPCKIAVDRSPFFHYMYASPLKPGMIFSNEPGVYKKGSHAIRIENTILVKEGPVTSCGEFLEFETLTFIPLEREAIDVSLLTGEELTWVNDYHQKTYEALRPFLTEEEGLWLKKQTEALPPLNQD